MAVNCHSGSVQEWQKRGGEGAASAAEEVDVERGGVGLRSRVRRWLAKDLLLLLTLLGAFPEPLTNPLLQILVARAWGASTATALLMSDDHSLSKRCICSKSGSLWVL